MSVERDKALELLEKLDWNAEFVSIICDEIILVSTRIKLTERWSKIKKWANELER